MARTVLKWAPEMADAVLAGYMRRVVVVVLLLLTTAASAAPPKVMCHEAKATLTQTCIDVANVSENGSLRAAPVYSGGPKEIEKTPYIMVVDCKKELATLQDRKGVNFAGNFSSTTPASRALSKEMCAAKPSRKDPTLRQF